MSDSTVKVRLLFADDGESHHETVEIPAASADRYDRLIDCFLEDTDVMKKLFVDVGRLVSARIED
mgnify:CR=1 FL=1